MGKPGQKSFDGAGGKDEIACRNVQAESIRFHGEAQARLRVIQSAEVHDIFVAHRLHGPQRGIRAASGTAIQDHPLRFVRHGGGDLIGNPVVRDVEGALQMPGRIFVRRTDVQQEDTVHAELGGLLIFFAHRGGGRVVAAATADGGRRTAPEQHKTQQSHIDFSLSEVFSQTITSILLLLYRKSGENQTAHPGKSAQARRGR